MKRLTAPHHWMLDKLTGRFVRLVSLATRVHPALSQCTMMCALWRAQRCSLSPAWGCVLCVWVCVVAARCTQDRARERGGSERQPLRKAHVSFAALAPCACSHPHAPLAHAHTHATLCRRRVRRLAHTSCASACHSLCFCATASSAHPPLPLPSAPSVRYELCSLSRRRHDAADRRLACGLATAWDGGVCASFRG
jgi:hypothetical protein